MERAQSIQQRYAPSQSKRRPEGIKIHPARFPPTLPEFFMRLLCDEGDWVLDPFSGSNTPGMVAEQLQRRWIAMDNVEEYLQASK
jgi:DNA modification methylase